MKKLQKVGSYTNVINIMNLVNNYLKTENNYMLLFSVFKNENNNIFICKAGSTESNYRKNDSKQYLFTVCKNDLKMMNFN